jgi:hypothetical protein
MTLLASYLFIFYQANHPVDESVLNALCLTFRNARADEECAECYENALAAQPTNEFLATELFNCYVRGGEFKKMQQVRANIIIFFNIFVVGSKTLQVHISTKIYVLDC